MVGTTCTEAAQPGGDERPSKHALMPTIIPEACLYDHDRYFNGINAREGAMTACQRSGVSPCIVVAFWPSEMGCHPARSYLDTIQVLAPSSRFFIPRCGKWVSHMHALMMVLRAESDRR